MGKKKRKRKEKAKKGKGINNLNLSLGSKVITNCGVTLTRSTAARPNFVNVPGFCQ